ncbi:tetratricopeptide repeat protein [Fluviicola sp.]|jgi:tetratricopeptide (TPR) repeat protein|uniref:tetratricopeptide repeat protein n=1 Tax=Fluviicola sp. TaxID=1917219 RepID=UPI002825C28B|nr:tetratricopeptide repeat protein [Fluviicola sp.]MDR0802445.1 tetratricopeptide repeat protein [Fluviicola sp.]
MKFVILFLFVLFATVSSDAQSIDPRKKWKQLTRGDESERIEAAKELSVYYQSESIDSLRMVGEILFFYGIDNHYQPAIEFGKITLAEFYVMTGRINDGIVIAKSTIQALQKRDDLELLSNVCRIIASGYRKLEDGNSSMLWAKKAITYTKNDPEAKDRTAGMISLAEAYLLKHKERKATQIYQDYIVKATEAKNYRGLSSAYSRLGDIYRISQRLNLAEKYFSQSFQAAQKTNLKSPKAHALNNLAIIYFEKGDTSKAHSYFMDALAIREVVNDVKAISESYYNLGDYHFYLDQFPEALSWYEKSAQIAEKWHLLSEEKDALLSMARVYRKMNVFDEATRCLEKTVIILSDLKLKQSADDEELTHLQHEIWKTDFGQREGKEIRQESSFWFYTLLISIAGLLVTIVLLVVKLNQMKK